MTPNISEFSYGYALTDNLIHGSGLGAAAAPVFPSLIAEGGLGYDLRLDRPGSILFLQFKLSHCMVRNNAMEIKTHGIFPRGSRFYRFYLHRTSHSDQHPLLLALEAAGSEVYYVAPAFHEPAELDEVYLSRTVAANSVFVRPSWIGAIVDADQHHVSFVLNGPRHWFSRPKPIEMEIGYESFASRVKSTTDHARGTLRESVNDLPKKMMVIVEEYSETLRIGKPKEVLTQRVRHVAQRRDELEPLAQMAYLSRTFFGCEPLLINQLG